jgi:hypothetical protein
LAIEIVYRKVDGSKLYPDTYRISKERVDHAFKTAKDHILKMDENVPLNLPVMPFSNRDPIYIDKSDSFWFESRRWAESIFWAVLIGILLGLILPNINFIK